MKRQTRQNVRRSQREGISVREAVEEDLSSFYKLYLATSQRQDFEPYPLEYFSTLWRIFAPSDYICIFLAEYQNKPLSALLVMRFGKTVYTKMCGWSGEEGQRRPNEAVYLAAIQWAKARGCRYLDFEGLDRQAAELLVQGQSLPDDLKETPALFKLGFGGEVGLYPEAYEYFYNPVFRTIYYRLYPTINTWPPTRRFIERFYRHRGVE